MDDLVFEREKLRRTLREQVDSAVGALDKAAEEYDAEQDFPVGDLMAGITLTALNASINSYVKIIADRVQTRADAAKEREARKEAEA